MPNLQSYLDKILGVADVRSITPSGREVYDPTSRSAQRFRPNGGMASRRTGAGQGSSIDIHVPLMSPFQPTVPRSRGRLKADVGLSSRFAKYGMHGRDDHIAEIFFETASADAQSSIEVLDQVAGLVSWLVFGGLSVNLRFEGLADVRGSKDYNARLSRRRSEAVKRHIDGAVHRHIKGFRGNLQQYSSIAVPYGESISHTRRSAYLQATDRVVDVLMDPPLKRPPAPSKTPPHKLTPKQRERVKQLLRKRFGLPGDTADAVSKGGDILSLIDALAGAPAVSLVGAAMGPFIAMFTLVSLNAELERAPSLLAMAYTVVAFAFDDLVPPKVSRTLLQWLDFGPKSSQYRRVVKAWDRFAALTLEKLRRDELWSLEGPKVYKAALRKIGGDDRQKAFKRYHGHLVKEYLGHSRDSATYRAASAHTRKFIYPN